MLTETLASIPGDGSLGKFLKDKLAVLRESFDTEKCLCELAGEIIAFLSREYGEHLPGDRPDVEALLSKAQAVLEGTAPAETAREMTAEQLIEARFSNELRFSKEETASLMRAYAKQRVEQAERIEAEELRNHIAEQNTQLARIAALLKVDFESAHHVADAAEAKVSDLERELQKRDKCSFSGPMRDCPTHGESEKLKEMREALRKFVKLFRIRPSADVCKICKCRYKHSDECLVRSAEKLI